MQAGVPLRLGHRGHRCPEWPEPENSLAAFDRALAAGCDGLELDLRHTADGRIVIHHDDALRCGADQARPAFAGGSAPDASRWSAPLRPRKDRPSGPAGQSFSPATERDLRRAPFLGLNFASAEPTRRSPRAVLVAEASLRSLRRLHPQLATLEQVLRRYRERAWLDLEMKTPEVVAGVARLLARYPPRRGFVVSSFDAPALRRLAALAPELPLCLNLRRPCSVRRLRGLPIQWVGPYQGSCTRWYVRRLRAQGWQVLVWTVNHPAKMRLLARAGANAIVSDFPDLLMQTLPRATPAGAPASFSEDEWNNGADGSRYPATSRGSGRVVSKP